jgi:hypothetical protein
VLSVTTVPQIGYVALRHPGTRSTNGPQARVEFGKMLLRERADYFRRHRGAAALRWQTIGAIALELGDSAEARRALARSLRARPSPATVRILASSLRRS